MEIKDYKASLREAYNHHAEQREASALADWKSTERQGYLEKLREAEAATILEIGAGTGKDSLFFRESGLRVKSVDLSEEMVRLCKEKGLDAETMDFHELAFPDYSFDAAYAMNCLLHVPKAELGKVLEEIERVLKPGGLFYCGMYGGEDSEGIWEQDAYEPKRFFAMYTDQALVSAAERHFALLDFHTVDMGEGNPHYQALLLKKR